MTEKHIKSPMAKINFKIEAELKERFRSMAFHTGVSMTVMLTGCLESLVMEYERGRDEGRVSE